MADILEYKCPNCGGAITFDSGLQKMKCPYCEAEFDMEDLQKKDEVLNENNDDLQWNINAGTEWSEGETAGLRSYICKSCGGEIVGDETMAATSCPYCDNPVVMTGQFSGILRPDYVLPFKLDKKAAKEGLSKHLKGKFLLPKVFKAQNHIDEIKGLYVPFWLFDADVDADINYSATKLRHWSDSKYDYTETSFYEVQRGGTVAFDHIPVDGSTKMADDLMESVEPFNFAEATDFQTAYLAGYLADKYDVSAEQSIDRANRRVKTSTEQVFAKTVQGYSSVTTSSSNIRLQNGKAKYALYPVWLLNTSWNGKKYTFAMNGQTGKFVGDLPLDKKKASGLLVGLAVGLSALSYGITQLLWMLGVIGG